MAEGLLSPSRTPASSLPAPLTPLLGREQELATLNALLSRPDVRLVTLSGPGGVGKTRLALQVATAVAGSLADGVSFVDLAAVRDPALVTSTIAQALGLHEAGTQSLTAQLCAVLRDKELLV